MHAAISDIWSPATMLVLGAKSGLSFLSSSSYFSSRYLAHLELRSACLRPQLLRPSLFTCSDLLRIIVREELCQCRWESVVIGGGRGRGRRRGSFALLEGHSIAHQLAPRFSFVAVPAPREPGNSETAIAPHALAAMSECSPILQSKVIERSSDSFLTFPAGNTRLFKQQSF
eukprot:234060-Hanusia_phi.AAC.3